MGGNFCQNWSQLPSYYYEVESTKIENVTFRYELSQITCEPTHIPKNSSSYYITTNLLLNLGAHSSLHKNSHHQIIFTNFDLEVYYLYHTSNTFGIIHWILMTQTKLFLIITNLISNGTMVCDDREPLHMNKRMKNFISSIGIFLKKNSKGYYIYYKYC